MTTCMWVYTRASGSASPKAIRFNARRSYANGAVAARSRHRELFVNVLNANATKRDAKQYLARFKPSPPSKLTPSKLDETQEQHNVRHRRNQNRLECTGVNLGGLYAPSRAVAESPQFIRQKDEAEHDLIAPDTMHVALVCLRAPDALDKTTLEGLAVTLAQLVKLDMRIILVLDLGETAAKGSSVLDMRRKFHEHAERLIHALARHSPESARFVADALVDNAGKVEVDPASLILKPLARSIIAIVPTLAYNESTELISVDTGKAMIALTKMLCDPPSFPDLESHSTSSASLDRILLLDPTGGIPSKVRNDGAHVFINLEQEFEDIKLELSEYAKSNGSSHVYQQHQANMEMLRDCLALLPSASSALIISPQEAASSSQVNTADETSIGAGTRRQPNTLIHNLLTNKPRVSSSLPSARFAITADGRSDTAIIGAPTSTLVKRGMPLAIIPAVDRSKGWQLPPDGHISLDLETDPRIDLARLVHLIDDSFRRKLDAQHYLSRIRNRVAGLIVAGEYEGGAILTWEQPHGTTDPSRQVPYLDKFAVLQSSQGSSGVADIVFQAMVRSCFPNGVCWRSRKDNPVNKWYFERAAASWSIPGTNWTMFWTGDGVETDEVRFRDYVAVCRDVVPSWADGKKPD